MQTKRKKPGEEHAEQEQAVAPEMDKVTEERMAELLGITLRALQTRRQRGKIPEGIWNRNGRSITYSRWRYEEWLESLWVCPLELKSEGTRSGSVSLGTVSAAGKLLPFPRLRKGSKRPAVYEIK
ncbi:hypothetical protein [Pseudomonas fontis]|uniref:DNA-binding protein n=1 Tax=Pseudomonas fontis TaxID=2942633 RepID=A0ABT5NXU4_9PSED|nr:hypothetical protein [Pseudomonas fontis]MDD0972471.1 hypothetical protein [Pseudomonas fontis]MDD0992995.1 hypothetical protein [Pseudomonas fontis]